MKRIILIFFLTFTSFINLYAQWARTYGGSDYETAWSIQQTKDGGYIIAGDTYSFGAGDCDFWILKLSSFGEIEWQKTYGGSDYDSARYIQQTNDGGYIVIGYTYSFGAGGCDFWILKLSSFGEIEWQKTYGGSNGDGANCISQTKEGGYIVAGGSYSFGAGSDDAWILKLSPTGDIQWQKTYGGYGIDSARVIQQTADNGYIVTGCTESFGEGYADVWVLKLSSTGTIEWQKTYGGYMSDSNLSNQSFIHATTDGGYIVTAYTWSFGAGYSDFWVLKLTSTGTIEWQKTYGEWNNYDTPRYIQQTTDGGYIVTGFTYSFGAGKNDVWVLKLNSVGSIEWQKTYGGSDYDYALFLQQTSDGGYVVGANTYSFGAGNYDVWILKLSSNGEILPSCGFAGTSEATITYSDASPQDTYSTALDSNATPQDTFVSPQDSDATVCLICPAQKYTLTISASEGGTTDPAPGAHSLDGGRRVTVTAQPDSRHRFSCWSGDVSGSENPITVVMNKDKLITANFIRKYTLTIAAGIGGTTNPLPGSYAYGVGAEVSITATPEPDYRFSGWTGDAPQGHENDNPLMLSMDKDKSIAANFFRSYKLTITTGKGGTTEPVPGTYAYDAGTEVSITAKPGSGRKFSGWSIDASGSDNPIEVIMDRDKWIAATFTAIEEEDKASSWELKCFIATAAYGSGQHPHVRILRKFRDKCLMTNRLGRGLVKFYYRYSPGIADIIAKHRALRLVVRISLLPMIAFSYSMLHFSPIVIGIIFAFIFTLPIFFVCFYRRRMKNSQVRFR